MSINANNAALNEILETINELPEAGSGKEEQEKTVDITENGTTVVTPDEGMTLGEVTVNVEVESGGGGTEEIGTFFSNFDSKGYPTKLTIKGLKTIPAQYLRPADNATAMSIKVYDIDLGVVETIGQSAFRNCFSYYNENARTLRIPSTVKTIGAHAFAEPRTPNIYFLGTPTSIDAGAFTTTRATNIYVPWAEGAVANAPWGATNATIHYNTTYDENGNPIEAEV